jgi:hypothetical protein
LKAATAQNMTETETKNTDEMKRYLFHEASADERQRLEERFFADDDLFFELVGLENDLVDRYVRNEMKASERARFENNLAALPERREKLANAAALQKFIAEEKPSPVRTINVIEENQVARHSGFNFFGFRMPALQLASAAMLILLTVGVGYLLYERARVNEELTRLRGTEQTERLLELEGRENALKEQIKQSNEREENLQNQINDERGQSDILDTELERERGEKLRLEREIEILRKQKANLPPVEPKEKEIVPPAPLIASIILSPVSSGKGVSSGVKTIKVSNDTTKISATLQIPKEATAETFSVKLEGAPLAENLKAQKTKQGTKFISVALPPQKLSPEKENLLTVTGNDQSRYDYIFRLQK